MFTIQQHTATLRENLSALMSGTHTQQQLNSVVALAHSFSISLLKKKVSSGKLNLSLLDLDVHDIGYDCIAELFRLDEHNSAIQLKAYFYSLSYDSLSNEELADHLRRLVFSKVNQGVFRMYYEYDSSLGKILRNIKITIQSLNNFIEFDRFGETYIVPALTEPHLHLPIMCNETMEEFLRCALHGNERIPDVLSQLSCQLKKQQEYAKAVSLIQFAVALRNIFSESTEFSQQEIVHPFQENDIKELIQSVSGKMQILMFEKYIATNKLTEEEYNSMFVVVQKNLSAIAVENDGQDFSLYDHFLLEIPGITKEEYKKRYKAILEYLLLLTKKELGKEIKRQL